MPGPDRRSFLTQMLGGTAATLTLPELLLAAPWRKASFS